jgi:hypothetical protein
MNRPAWVYHGLSLAALVWCGVVLLFHWAAGAFACGWDTSYCAQSRDKDGLYRGVLVDRQGRTVTNTPFTVGFESRRNAEPGEVGGFSTDSAGRFCILWAQERITPSISLDGAPEGSIQGWEPLNGSDPPLGCQAGDEGIPWNRADDLKTSPQFMSVPALAVPAAALLLVALLGGRTGTQRLRQAGFALTFASTLLAVILWFG